MLHNWTFGETLSATDLNDLIASFPKSMVVGLSPAVIGKSTTSGSYGAAALSQHVRPVLGRYLNVKIFASVSGGGTGSIKVDVTGPGGTDTLTTLTTTSAGGETKEATIDLSALATNGDLRGEDATFNIYLKTTAGTLAIAGAVLATGEGSTNGDFLSP